MLQEISTALGISLDEVCKMYQENYTLFDWFEDKIEEVKEEYKDALEEKDQEIKWREQDIDEKSDEIYWLEDELKLINREIESLKELLSENGIINSVVERKKW